MFRRQSRGHLRPDRRLMAGYIVAVQHLSSPREEIIGLAETPSVAELRAKAASHHPAFYAAVRKDDLQSSAPHAGKRAQHRRPEHGGRRGFGVDLCGCEKSGF